MLETLGSMILADICVGTVIMGFLGIFGCTIGSVIALPFAFIGGNGWASMKSWFGIVWKVSYTIGTVFWIICVVIDIVRVVIL